MACDDRDPDIIRLEQRCRSLENILREALILIGGTQSSLQRQRLRKLSKELESTNDRTPHIT